MSEPTVLVLNAGSSTLKGARFDGAQERVRAEVELNGRAPADALDQLLDHFAPSGRFPLDAIGHRIVHGGAHDTPAIVDDALAAELRGLAPLAPLHQEPGLALLDATRDRYADIPQIACFDTAFHRAMPEVAQRFALSERWWNAGVRRYGFHGLSFTFLVDTVAEARAGRVVLAHLGSGASLAALLDGAPQDTTMGLTPTGGLVMATRTGDLDPGVMLYLARALDGDVAALERVVDRESGLLGASGTTGDVRRLLAARDTDLRAALAVELFCRSVRKNIGALAAVLGGLDVLVFTGGIGEHSPDVRAQVAAGLGHLGVRLDPAANAASGRDVSEVDASCTTLVVPTDEESVIARGTRELLR